LHRLTVLGIKKTAYVEGEDKPIPSI